MPSPMNGVRPPYTLPSNIVYFHDWRYVDGGYLRWLGADDQPVALMPPPDPVSEMHASWEWVPKGVRIVAMPATVDEQPVITATELNETIFFGGSVLFEDGLYRMFYESIHPDGFSNPDKLAHIGHYKYLRYAESDDGYAWRFPDCGMVVPNDTTNYNNVVFDPGDVGYHGGCVFIDPSSKEERYKSIFLGQISREGVARYLAARPNDFDPMAIMRQGDPRGAKFGGFGVFGATSPDGLQWTLLPEPMLIQHSDTFHACTYDEVQGKYVAYLRSWLYGRRTVARAESSDFRSLGLPEQICWPDPGMAPYDTWYTSGYTRMPGAPDYHLMFPTLWSQLDDSFTPHLYSSPDGAVWSRVSDVVNAGGGVVPEAVRHDWCRCGMAMINLVPLPGDRIGSMVLGWHIPHKHPRAMPFGYAGWVWWQRGRLTALRAEREGQFALYPLHFEGREVVLNFRTRFAGSIQVAAHGKACYRTFEDCDPISGDALEHVVSWKGQTDIGHDEGEAVQLQFRLHNADLFSVSFR